MLLTGDTDGDLQLDQGEIWEIREGDGTINLGYTVTQDDFDSNATIEPDDLLPGKIDNESRLDGYVGGPTGTLETISMEGVSVPIVLNPEIDIEKTTNGEDADSPTGPFVPLGAPVTWTYTVTNPGNVALSVLLVVDDNGTPGDLSDDFSPAYVSGDADGDGLLDVSETWIYETIGSAEIGQYANLASVTGMDPAGTPVMDEDPSHYFGSNPSIDIEKATNGEDADSPTGPFIAVGDPVTWTYVVTNDGNVDLTGVSFVDDMGTADLADDVTVVIGDLAAGETYTHLQTGTAMEGQYGNLATATGTGPAGTVVYDEDPSHYFGEEPLTPGANTPGFWKNFWRKHPDAFEAVTGVSGEDSYADVFGISTDEGNCFDRLDGYDMYDALSARGGGVMALARHSAAAYANAESPITDYAYGDYVAAFEDDVLATIMLIDLNSDGVIVTDEVVTAIQDIAGDLGPGDNFECTRRDILAVKDAFDDMNNVLPEIEKADFFDYVDSL